MHTLKLYRIIMLMVLASLLTNSCGFEKNTVRKNSDEIISESDGFEWRKLRQDGYYGAEDKNGHILIPLSRQYDRVYYTSYYDAYSNGHAYFNVRKNGKYGICDKDGNEVISPKYDNIVYYPVHRIIIGDYLIVGGYYGANIGGKKCAINSDGTELVAPLYESLTYYPEDRTFKYCDTSNKMVPLGIILPGCAEEESRLKQLLKINENENGVKTYLHKEEDGFEWYWISKNGRCGAINKDGDTIISMSKGYDSLAYGDISPVIRWSNYQRIKVRLKSPLKREEYANKRLGWFTVYKNGKAGSCDMKGKEIIVPKKYDTIHYVLFDEYYQVKANRKWGVCDKYGKEVLPPNKYDYISSKIGDTYVVRIGKKDSKYGVCDTNGIEIIVPKYEDISSVGNAYKVKLYGKYGVCNSQGKEIIKPTYDRIDQDDDFIIVKLGNKYGAFNSYGVEIIPPIYDHIQYVSKSNHDKNGSFLVKLNGELIRLCEDGSKKNDSNSLQIDESVAMGMYSLIMSILSSTTAPDINNGNKDYLLDPNYAILQTEQQNRAEYVQFCQHFKKPDGSNFTYEEFMAAKAKVWAETQGTIIDDNKGETPGNPIQPHQITEDCPICHGSGKCNSCNGTHRINYQFGSGSLECPNCKPDGRCTHCGGTGKETKTRYY